MKKFNFLICLLALLVSSLSFGQIPAKVSMVSSKSYEQPPAKLLMENSMSFGQPPSNDACIDAIDASPLPYANTQDASDATNNGGFITVAGCSSMNDGVWYTVTGDGGNITVNAAPGAWDNAIGVYTGSCGAFVCEGFVDANVQTIAEEITFASVVGTVYYINVGYWSGSTDGSEGIFDITITTDAVDAPPNDACADAINVSAFPYSNTQDATNATNNGGFITVASCSSMNDGVWYTVTGDGSNLTVNVAPGAWDPALGIYTGSCGTFVCEAFVDAGVPTIPEEITFASAAGTVYYINVGYWSGSTDGSEGIFDISITSDEIQPTESCGQEQVSNDIENATFIFDTQRVANDFILDLNTTNFTLNSINTNIWTFTGIIDSVDIMFLEDDNGFPGAQIGATIDDLVPTSQVIIGIEPNIGMSVHEVVLDLPVPIDFVGTGTEAVTYWIEFVINVPSGSFAAWETTTLNPIGEFISFNFNTGDGWQINTIDDGVFVTEGICTYITGCLAVTNITFSNIMADQATIGWDDTGMAADGFIVSVFDMGANPDTDTPLYTENVPAGATSTTATNLIGNSIYDVYITADCGGGDLSARNMSSFLTAPLIPLCGDKFYDTGGPAGDYTNLQDYDITILPDTLGDVVTATFNFVNTNPPSDVLTVDVGDGVTQVIPQIMAGDPAISYTSIAADGALFFTFKALGVPGVPPSAGWDADISCGLPPTCLPPTNFMVMGVTDTTADFSWDEEPNATDGYIITIFNAGDNPNGGGEVDTVIVPFGTNSETVLGLPQDDAFDAYIASDCGADGVSARSSLVSFITELSNLTCGDQFVDSGGVNGNYQNDELRTSFFMPDTPGEVVTITFTYVDIEASGTGGNQGCWDYLTVYDGPDTSWPLIAEVKCGEESGDGGQPSFPDSVLLIGDSFTATNPDGALTVVFTSDDGTTETGWEADVTCGLPATCIPPSNFMVTGVTDTTVDFSWDEEPNASNGYTVTVFLGGDDPDTDTPIGTEMVPFGTNITTITGLTTNVAYDAYIISDCDADGVSFRSMISFTSALTPLTCGDQFIDSGGINGEYQNNESRIVTILPDTSGDGVTITFTHVDIETNPINDTQDGCWDFLTIYDGPDTSSPVLAATLCGEESGDGDVPFVASSLLSVGDSFAATNPANGALTIVFSSDGSVPETGWVADVTCGQLSIDDFAAAGFNYYPNPTTGILSVGAKQPIEAIVLFNILGQKVLEIRPNALNTTLDLSSLNAGTYVMKSTINGDSYTHKVIKN